MAAWFDKLKTLFDVHVDIDLSHFTLFKINIGTINRAKGGSNVTTTESPYFLDEANQILQIDPSKLSPKKFEEFKRLINEEYIPEGNYLLEKDSSLLLEKLYTFNKTSEYRQHLSFFKDILAKDDYAALESSYFLRKEHDSGGRSTDIAQFKRDITEEFGQRGGHIANLCTAGYFEELLIPVYNHNKNEFWHLYKLVVEERALTIFIHAWMKKDELLAKLKNKLDLAKKYGLPHFYIHAKGKSNIKTIHEYLDEYGKEHGTLSKVEKNIPELGVVVIQIILK